jgi:hypothetical protein
MDNPVSNFIDGRSPRSPTVMPIDVRSAEKAGAEREMVAIAASSAAFRIIMCAFSLVFVYIGEEVLLEPV